MDVISDQETAMKHQRPSLNTMTGEFISDQFASCQ